VIYSDFLLMSLSHNIPIFPKQANIGAVFLPTVAARDEHKCAISGIFDIGYWRPRSGSVVGNLTCAHILKRAGTHEGQTVSIIIYSLITITND
jgi:hypothetical protein